MSCIRNKIRMIITVILCYNYVITRAISANIIAILETLREEIVTEDLRDSNHIDVKILKDSLSIK